MGPIRRRLYVVVSGEYGYHYSAYLAESSTVARAAFYRALEEARPGGLYTAVRARVARVVVDELMIPPLMEVEIKRRAWGPVYLGNLEGGTSPWAPPLVATGIFKYHAQLQTVPAILERLGVSGTWAEELEHGPWLPSWESLLDEVER